MTIYYIYVCVCVIDNILYIMCVCYLAIEKAMAYLDTGELPWDMELFESKEVLLRMETFLL